MGDKLAKSKNLCCHLVVFTRYSLLRSFESSTPTTTTVFLTFVAWVGWRLFPVYEDSIKVISTIKLAIMLYQLLSTLIQIKIFGKPDFSPEKSPSHFEVAWWRVSWGKRELKYNGPKLLLMVKKEDWTSELVSVRSLGNFNN